MSREDLRAAAAAEVDRWERQLTDELLRVFDRQEGVVLARLQGTKARKHTRHWEPAGERKIDPSYILDPARWLMDAIGSVTPLFRRLVTSVFGRVHSQLAGRTAPAAPGGGSQAQPTADSPAQADTGGLAPVVAAILEAAIEARLGVVGQGVQNAAAEVQAVIAQAEDEGVPMAELAARVRQLYADRRQVWAERIATVNAVGAINQASLEAAEAAGSSAKQWLSVKDDRVRPTHKKADGQVRLLHEPFRLGGIPEHPKRSTVMYPGDPAGELDEIMNCRCTMLFSPPRR